MTIDELIAELRAIVGREPPTVEVEQCRTCLGYVIRITDGTLCSCPLDTTGMTAIMTAPETEGRSAKRTA